MQLVAQLSEPFWGRQPTESEADWAAFSLFLATRSLARVCNALGLPLDSVNGLAQRWAWNARTGAYDRAVGQHIDKVCTAALTRSTAKMHSILNRITDIVDRELEKRQIVVHGAGAETLDDRSVTALCRAATQMHKVLHEGPPIGEALAEGAPLAPDSASWDLGRLTPEEMEGLRKARDKARGRL